MSTSVEALQMTAKTPVAQMNQEQLVGWMTEVRKGQPLRLDQVVAADYLKQNISNTGMVLELSLSTCSTGQDTGDVN